MRQKCFSATFKKYLAKPFIIRKSMHCTCLGVAASVYSIKIFKESHGISLSAGRARQRETVVPTSWSKLTLLQHLAEVTLPWTLPTLWM